MYFASEKLMDNMKLFEEVWGGVNNTLKGGDEKE
jgi:hypothetical protein